MDLPPLKDGLNFIATRAMDAHVDKCMHEALSLWEKHPLHCRAHLKLIFAPRHGVLKGEVQDHLIWSHDTTSRGTTPGLAQTLPNALLSAVKNGFKTVILQYCHTATAIRRLQPFVAKQTVEGFNFVGKLIVLGFDGVEMNPDSAELGCTDVFNFLKRGAPVSHNAVGVGRQFVLRGDVYLYSPVELGKGMRNLPPLAYVAGLRFVGKKGVKKVEHDEEGFLTRRAGFKKKRRRDEN